MDKKILKKALEMLYDRPLNRNNRELFVDRERELNQLTEICELEPMGIFGLCGETGVGKTSILRMLDVKGAKTLFLVLTEKKNKESIIADFLYKLALSIEKDPDFEETAKKIKEWVINETTTATQGQFGVSAGVNAKISKTSSSTRKFNIYEAAEKIAEIVGKLRNRYDKLIIIIDELDKERKNDVLEVLDSIKDKLMLDNVISIFSLPFSIYREYARDRMKFNESGNLENIFEDVIFLESLNDTEIETIIAKRLKEFPLLLSQDILRIISRFACGNPRDALWVSYKIIFNGAQEESKITASFAENVVRLLVKEYFGYIKNISENKKESLRVLANEQGDKNFLAKLLVSKRNMKRTTAYMTIKRLLEDSLLIERNGVIQVSGKVYFLL